MSTAWTFNRQQLQEALERYVEEGPPATKMLRQEEADNTIMVLGSHPFEKMRVPHGPVS